MKIKTRWWIGGWALLTALHAAALVLGNLSASELPVLLLAAAVSNALLVLAARFVARILTDAYSTEPTHICAQCHGRVRGVARGNLIVEIALWMLLIVPGAIYSFWRFSGPRTCPRCDGEAIPLDSPDAQGLLAGGGA
ncbi:MAG: hypothetical protein AB1405_12905 [Bdellovibrionota bacterium]